MKKKMNVVCVDKTTDVSEHFHYYIFHRIQYILLMWTSSVEWNEQNGCLFIHLSSEKMFRIFSILQVFIHFKGDIFIRLERTFIVNQSHSIITISCRHKKNHKKKIQLMHQMDVHNKIYGMHFHCNCTLHSKWICNKVQFNNKNLMSMTITIWNFSCFLLSSLKGYNWVYTIDCNSNWIEF